tara:strand:- start:10526 stop:11251 length:726 start_codon:yes stop_codon:yes gene_type:complete
MDISFDGNIFNLPIHWSEVTLGQIIESDKILNNMPEKLFDETFNDKDVTYDADDEIDNWKFYREWVGFWVKIPDNYELKVSDLKWLYTSLQYLMGAASEDDILIHETFTFNGVKYGLPKAEKLLNGSVKEMADSTYAEFIECAQLTTKIGQLKKGDVSALPMLTAILYRPIIKTGFWFWKKEKVSDYKEKEVQQRMEEFKKLPMDKVWGAYFFLTEHLSVYLVGLQSSLKERVAATGSGGI